MDGTEFQLIGFAVSAVITLGAFIGVVMKFTQPINDLRIVIQKLNDIIDNMKQESEYQEKQLAKHDEEINKLDGRVGKLETKMDVYHHE